MCRMPRGSVILVVSFAVVLFLAAGCSDDATSPPDEGVVRGVVNHTYSGAPLAGITVAIADQTTTTAGDGSFQFAHVVQGAQVLQAWSADFQPHQRAIDVRTWQSYEIALSPLDTLVTMSGRVFHADDGNLEVDLLVGSAPVTSGDDGRWSLDDVPMGWVTITVNSAPYQPHEERVNLTQDGQEFAVRLRRIAELVLPVEHDSYVFTDSDSLNANRGQYVALWASPSLGRRAFLLLPSPGSAWDDATIASATLELHGNLRVDDDQYQAETAIPVTIWWLVDSFYENSVDYFTRPDSELGPNITVNLNDASLDQPFDIDVTAAYVRPDPYPGLVLSVFTGHAGLGIASSEFGRQGEPAAELRPRVRMILAY